MSSLWFVCQSLTVGDGTKILRRAVLIIDRSNRVLTVDITVSRLLSGYSAFTKPTQGLFSSYSTSLCSTCEIRALVRLQHRTLHCVLASRVAPFPSHRPRTL